MPNGDSYIAKVYQNLNAAYGKDGGMTPGVFTTDFNTFQTAMQNNTNYAGKIFDALQKAYGTNGEYSPGAFPLNYQQFRNQLGLFYQSPFKKLIPTLTSQQSENVRPYNYPINSKQDTPSSASASDAFDKDQGGIGDFFQNIYNHAVSSTIQTGEGLARSAVSGIENQMKVAPYLLSKVLPGAAGQKESAVVSGINKVGENINNVLTKGASVATALGQSPIENPGQQMANVAISQAGVPTDADKIDAYYHFKGGSIGQKLGAAVGGIASMAPQIAMSAALPESSIMKAIPFIAGAYQDSYADAKNNGMSDEDSNIFGLASGTIVGGLNSIPIMNMFNKDIINKYVSNFIAKGIMKGVEENGGKALSASELHNILSDIGSSVATKIRVAGIKGLQAGGQGILFGALGTAGQQGTEYLANKMEGRPVFDMKDFTVSNYINQMGYNALMLGTTGSALGFMSTHVGSYAADKLATNASDQAVADLKQSLANNGRFNAMDDGSKLDIMNNIDKMASVIKGLPQTMTLPQKKQLLALTVQRDGMDDIISDMQKQNETGDAALQDINNKNIEANKTAVELMNDRIREVYAGQRYSYNVVNAPDGSISYQKTLGNAAPEAISESLYNLASDSNSTNETNVNAQPGDESFNNLVSLFNEVGNKPPEQSVINNPVTNKSNQNGNTQTPRPRGQETSGEQTPLGRSEETPSRSGQASENAPLQTGTSQTGLTSPLTTEQSPSERGEGIISAPALPTFQFSEGDLNQSNPQSLAQSVSIMNDIMSGKTGNMSEAKVDVNNPSDLLITDKDGTQRQLSFKDEQTAQRFGKDIQDFLSGNKEGNNRVTANGVSKTANVSVIMPNTNVTTTSPNVSVTLPKIIIPFDKIGAPTPEMLQEAFTPAKTPTVQAEDNATTTSSDNPIKVTPKIGDFTHLQNDLPKVEQLSEIGHAFNRMQGINDDPDTKEAYSNLKNALLKQFKKMNVKVNVGEMPVIDEADFGKVKELVKQLSEGGTPQVVNKNKKALMKFVRWERMNEPMFPGDSYAVYTTKEGDLASLVTNPNLKELPSIHPLASDSKQSTIGQPIMVRSGTNPDGTTKYIPLTDNKGGMITGSRNLKMNEILAITHGTFGRNGNEPGIGVAGNENGWANQVNDIIHLKGMTDDQKLGAIRALTTEIRGKNSAVNYVNTTNRDVRNPLYEAKAKAVAADDKNKENDVDDLIKTSGATDFGEDKYGLLPIQSSIGDYPETAENDKWIMDHAGTKQMPVSPMANENEVLVPDVSPDIKNQVDRVTEGNKPTPLQQEMNDPSRLTPDAISLIRESESMPVTTFLHKHPNLTKDDYFDLRENYYDTPTTIDHAIAISQKVRDWLESKKLDTSGNLYTGVPFDKIWNAGINTVQKSLQSAETFLKGVSDLSDYLNEHFGPAWDKAKVSLGLSNYAKSKGFNVDTNAINDIVNRDYQPTVKDLLQTKPDQKLENVVDMPDAPQSGNPKGVLVGEDKDVELSSASGIVSKMKTVFARNLSQLNVVEKRIPGTAEEGLQSAYKAATASSTALARYKLAMNDIYKDLGGGQRAMNTIGDLGKVLVQSRLNGLKLRYQDMAQVASSIDNDSMNKWYNDSEWAHDKGLAPLPLVAESISQYPSFSGFDRQLASLISNGAFDQARASLKNAFDKAGSSIKDVDFGDETYDDVRKNPDVQMVKGMLQDKIGDLLSNLHEQANGSLLEDRYLGEEGVYIPLNAIRDENEPKPFSIGKRVSLARQAVTNNQFATGMAKNGYLLQMNVFAKRLADAYRVTANNDMINTLSDEGIMAKWSAGNRDDVMNLGGTGRMVKAEKINVNEGKGGMAPSYYLIPHDLKGEVNILLGSKYSNDDPVTKTAIQKVTGALNRMYLSTPIEATIHGANLFSRLMMNTPFAFTSDNPIKNFVGTKIGALPVIKNVLTASNMLFMNPNSDYYRMQLNNMMNDGIDLTKFFSHTFNKDVAQLTGANLDRPYPTIQGSTPINIGRKTINLPNIHLPSFGALLYGRTGLDVRARLMLYSINKAMNPDATPLAMQRTMSMLGQYNPLLQSDMVRVLKNTTGIAPFAVSRQAAMENALKSFSGGNLALEGMSRGKQAFYKAMNIANSSIYTFLGAWALGYYSNTGKNPFTTPGSRLGIIPATEEQKAWMKAHPDNIISKTLERQGGKYSDIDLGALYSVARTGLEISGLSRMFGQYSLGANPGEVVEKGFTQSLNYLLSPIESSPAVQTFTNSLFGDAPYIVSLRNEEGQPEVRLLPVVEPAKPGHQLQSNLVYGLTASLPYTRWIPNELGLTRKYTGHTGWENAIAQNILESILPRMFVAPLDASTSRKYIIKQRKSEETAYLKAQKVRNQK